jgi:uncharacterized membrane protein
LHGRSAIDTTTGVGVVLAALSALTYGCADYCGGRATRRAAAWTVTASSQLIGLLTVLVCLPLAWGNGPSVRAISLGAFGGIAGAIGIMLLYHALAHGTMSVVSPVTAVVAAVVPFLFGVGSQARHLAAAHERGLAVREFHTPGMELDVDRPDDLLLLAETDGETQTQRLVRELCVAERVMCV